MAFLIVDPSRKRISANAETARMNAEPITTIVFAFIVCLSQMTSLGTRITGTSVGLLARTRAAQHQFVCSCVCIAKPRCFFISECLGYRLCRFAYPLRFVRTPACQEADPSSVA